MKKLLQTASVSLLALFVGVGCGSSESSGDLATQQAPANTEVPTPPEPEVAPQYEGPISVPGLTAPTDARDILARTGEEPGRNRGVADPFAVIPVDAIGQAPPAGEPPTAPTTVAAGTEEVVPPPAGAEAAPGPSRADAVRVTGVVHVNDTIRAIIESPDEPTSRHVRVGQFIAGTVLVKGIEIDRQTPAVILEENGVEIFKPIGEEPEFSSSFIAAASSPAIAAPPPPPDGIH